MPELMAKTPKKQSDGGKPKRECQVNVALSATELAALDRYGASLKVHSITKRSQFAYESLIAFLIEKGFLEEPTPPMDAIPARASRGYDGGGIGGCPPARAGGARSRERELALSR